MSNLPIALIAGSSVGLSLVLTWLMIRLAPLLGLVDVPGGRKAHEKPTPLGGGIAMVLAFAAPLVVLRGFIYALKPEEADVLDNVLWAIVLGSLFMGAVGLMDDRISLSPSAKLAAQFILGLAVFISCPALRITLFVSNTILSAVYTILWMLVVTNAFNLLDNMDGLSAGVAAITAVVLICIGVDTGQYFLAVVALAFLGVLAGFLVFNFPPAKIFMGDAGSLFIGFVMWALTAGFTYYSEERQAFRVLFIPVLVLGLPLYDTVSVILIRLKEHRPIFRGDRSHFSHRLVGLGMTTREAVLTIYLVTLTISLSARNLYRLDLTGAVVLFIQTLSVFAIIYVLERTGRRSR